MSQNNENNKTLDIEYNDFFNQFHAGLNSIATQCNNEKHLIALTEIALASFIPIKNIQSVATSDLTQYPSKIYALCQEFHLKHMAHLDTDLTQFQQRMINIFIFSAYGYDSL